MRIRSPGICHCRPRYREVRSPGVVEPGGDGNQLEIHARTKLRCRCRRRTRAARPGCTFSLFWSCFAPVIAASQATPTDAAVRPFPVFLPCLTGKSPAPGCARCPVFLLLFTGIYRQTGVDCTGLYPWAETPNQEVHAPAVAGGPCARAARHALFQLEPERVGLVGDL